MRIGIIGAGQLGQMLGDAALALGHECRFLDPAEAPPAARCGDVLQAAFDDRAALRKLADWAEVITYEFENVPVAALDAVGDVDVYPPRQALQETQDRLTEKQLFERLDIPLPRYAVIESRDDLNTAAETLGLPFVVKTRRFGYDGKGQVVVRDHAALDDAWQMLDGRAAIAEAWVRFDCEVSIIGVRSTSGEIRTWPLSRNDHRDGILHISRAPVDDRELHGRASDYIGRLLKHLDYVGVLALELFVAGDELLANEYAPRVHNSGHWTIEGANCSQFENHIRAICGSPLGDTSVAAHSGMLNLVGAMPDSDALPDDIYLHDYGKAARSARKLGHITVVATNADERDATIRKLAKNVTWLA